MSSRLFSAAFRDLLANLVGPFLTNKDVARLQQTSRYARDHVRVVRSSLDVRRSCDAFLVDVGCASRRFHEHTKGIRFWVATDEAVAVLTRQVVRSCVRTLGPCPEFWFVSAVRHGSTAMVDWLVRKAEAAPLSTPVNLLESTFGILEATVPKDNVPMLRHLLGTSAAPLRQQTRRVRRLLRVACTSGADRIVGFLLDTFEHLRPQAMEQAALRCACDNKHTRVALRLLRDLRVEPNAAAVNACIEHGLVHVLRAILEHPATPRTVLPPVPDGFVNSTWTRRVLRTGARHDGTHDRRNARMRAVRTLLRTHPVSRRGIDWRDVAVTAAQENHPDVLEDVLDDDAREPPLVDANLALLETLMSDAVHFAPRSETLAMLWPRYLRALREDKTCNGSRARILAHTQILRNTWAEWFAKLGYDEALAWVLFEVQSDQCATPSLAFSQWFPASSSCSGNDDFDDDNDRAATMCTPLTAAARFGHPVCLALVLHTLEAAKFPVGSRRFEDTRKALRYARHVATLYHNDSVLPLLDKALVRHAHRQFAAQPTDDSRKTTTTTRKRPRRRDGSSSSSSSTKRHRTH